MTDQQYQPDDATLIDWVLESGVRIGPNISRGCNGFRAYIGRRGRIEYLPGEGKTKKEAAIAAWRGLHAGTK